MTDPTIRVLSCGAGDSRQWISVCAEHAADPGEWRS